MQINSSTQSCTGHREPQGDLNFDLAEENLRRHQTSIDQFSFDFSANACLQSESESALISKGPDLPPIGCNAPSDAMGAAETSPTASDSALLPTGSSKSSRARYGSNAIEQTLAMLLQHEQVMTAKGQRLRRRRNALEDQVSLRALAEDANIHEPRLRLPGIADAIAAMAKRVGIEPVEKVTSVGNVLKKIDELEAHLVQTGGAMPRNSTRHSNLNIRAVKTLLGLPPDGGLPAPALRRVEELYEKYGCEAAPASIIQQRVLAWAEMARSEGLSVPSSAEKPNEPLISACAAIIGTNSAPLYRPEYVALFKQLGCELGFEIAPRTPTAQHSAKMAKEPAYLALIEAWAAQEDLKVPQHPSHPGRPWFEIACGQIGIPASALTRHPGLRDTIAQIGDQRGYATVIRSVSPGAVLLQELRQKALAWRADDVKGTSSASAQVANLRWRLNQLAELHADGELADAAQLLAAAAKIKPKDDKFHGEMRVLGKYLKRIEQSRELPADFVGALRELCKRAHMSFRATSREAGLPQETVSRWINTGCPGVQRRTEVELVERALGAETATLVSRMSGLTRGFRHTPLSRFTESLRADPVLRSRVAARMSPTDFALSDENFKLRCDVLEAEILAGNKVETGLGKRASGHSLGELPPQVAQQFKAICEVAQLDGPKRREAIAKYDIFDDTLGWATATIVKHERTLKSFFGYLAIPLDGRAEIQLSDMTLALSLVPAFSLEYANWLPTLREPRHDGSVLSRADTFPLSLFVTLLRPDGVLRRMPSLAQTLRPIPGYLDDGRIRWIAENWADACDSAYDRLRSFGRSFFDHEFARPAEFSGLMPILQLEDPSHAVTAIMLRRIREARWLMDESGSIAWARLVRNEMYLHCQDQMAFRTRTLCRMQPKHFSMPGNRIVLQLPREFFKNRKSVQVWKPGRYWTNFERDLDDKRGAHAVYDLYVNQARPILIGARPDPGSFFVNDDGSAKEEFSYLARSLSLDYLIDWPGADDFWRQQAPLSNHDFRHILATSLIRRTGKWNVVAQALKDTIEMVRSTYGMLRSEDQDNELREAMEGRSSSDF